jgi:RNA polymerase sigma-70 factor, ECF subfamily
MSASGRQNAPADASLIWNMPQHELDRLYDDHAQAVFSFLLGLTRHEADCRDLLQDLFVKLARNPELLRPVRNPRSFLLRMAHNAAIDLARRRAARAEHETDPQAGPVALFAPADDPDTQSFREALSAALGELPPEQRAVVHLKLWEGLTFEAVATTLEIPLNTAASRYRYGLDKLRARLRPLYDEIV